MLTQIDVVVYSHLIVPQSNCRGWLWRDASANGKILIARLHAVHPTYNMDALGPLFQPCHDSEIPLTLLGRYHADFAGWTTDFTKICHSPLPGLWSAIITIGLGPLPSYGLSAVLVPSSMSKNCPVSPIQKKSGRSAEVHICWYPQCLLRISAGFIWPGRNWKSMAPNVIHSHVKWYESAWWHFCSGE